MEKRFQKRLKITAGPHAVGVAFLKKSSATTLELLQPFERERLDPITPVGIPELDKVTIEGTVQRDPVGRTRRAAESLHVQRRARAATEAACAQNDSLVARAPRVSRPVSDTDMTRLLGFYAKERASGGGFDAGIESALRFLLVHPRFLYRVEQDPDNAAPGIDLSDQRSRAGLAAVVLHLEQHPGRGAADRRDGWPAAESGGARAAGPPHAQGRARARPGQQLRRTVAVSAQPARTPARRGRLPDFDHNLREALQRETELLFESIVLEDKSVTTLLERGLHVPERAARAPLRRAGIYGTQFRRSPVTNDGAKGLAGSRQRSGADLTEQPHVAGACAANTC